MTLCPYCQTRKAQKHRRGLCFSCAMNPAIRVLYPSKSKYSQWADGNASVAHWPQCPSCREHLSGPTIEVCATCQFSEPERTERRDRILLYTARAGRLEPIFQECKP